MKKPVRPLAAACALLLAACAGLTTTAPAAAARAPGGVTAATGAGVEIPDTPLGDALRWVLDASGRAPIGESELAGHFSPEFLAAVPAGQINQVLAAYRDMRVLAVSVQHAAALVASVETGGRRYLLTVGVDGAGLINGLRITEPPEPRPAPASWDELERRLRAAAPRAGFVAAEVTGRSCRPVRGVAADVRRPLGSMFKLFVLGTVAAQIKRGAYGWDTELTITPELKSLPSGRLQDRPDGSKVTVLEAAELMISISDNTATDLLVHRAGRRAVERTMRAWTKGHERRNEPLLTTRELFVLKGARYPELAERYLAEDTRGRRAYLADVVAKEPLSGITGWQEPRELGTIEWFASPMDVCRAYAGLAKLDDGRIAGIMSANDAGIGLPEDRWSPAWFKGGSEPGVFDLSFRARTSGGRTYVVTLMGVNPDAPFDDGRTGQEFLALARGAFGLAVE
ncbi:serine hydrolase [Nonomuraea sp. SBT364]|uniref:serine hydrolase n=1 Tax=Nonomuraea sp. SBT364 TaxID=1580530 RepID=UPI00066B06AB|nr:serine hydrolase [Nonomuraea sp. SBT364]